MRAGDRLPYPRPPTAAAAWAFERYLRGQARRYFAAVHWAREAGPVDGSVRTIFVANHSNWWDGFLAYLTTRALGLRFQILMEARHLARYRAFLHVGALPLRRHSPRGAYEDLEAARRYLVPGAALWIFPQGERRPAAERPHACERGVAHLALGAGEPVRICPVAFRYGFLGEQVPEAFVLVGRSWAVVPGAGGKKELMTEIESRMNDTLDTLDARLAAERVDGFEPLVRGRMSVNKRMDRFRHAVGLLEGPFEPRNG